MNLKDRYCDIGLLCRRGIVARKGIAALLIDICFYIFGGWTGALCQLRHISQQPLVFPRRKTTVGACIDSWVEVMHVNTLQRELSRA